MGNHRVWISCICTLFFVLPTITIPTVFAQSDDKSWSDPIIVFKGGGEITTPYLSTDDKGGVHLFWRYAAPPDETGLPVIPQLYYSMLDGTSWTKPNDIEALSGISSPSASVDPSGKIHLIWSGSLGWQYYTRSDVGDSISAQNWTRPIPIAGGNLQAQIFADKFGTVHLVYPGAGPDGPYYQKSLDAGNTWSPPVNIAPTLRKNSSANYTRLAVGDDKTIHVVWTEFQLPTAWPPTGVFYSHSMDEGKTWSKPLMIAGADYDQINIAVSGKMVHTIYNGQVKIGGRYHRWSADGGDHWSGVDVLTKQGGTSGLPQLVIDSTGVLHVLLSYGNAQYYYWQNGKWSAPQCVSCNVVKGTDEVEEPVMAISEGNRLHIAFWISRKSLWYTTKLVNAPRVYQGPFSTPNSPTLQPTIKVASVSEPTPEANNIAVPLTPNQPANMNMLFLLGILPVLALICCVIVFRLARFGSRQ